MKIKKLHTFKTKGFTLVEILVVITIIAILASFGFAGVRRAIERAKQVSAVNTCTQLAIGVENFFDEYNYLPNVGNNGGGDAELETDEGPFIPIIIGRDETNNPKKQRFFSTKDAKANRDGLVISGNDAQLFDPYGNAYFVRLDTNYDLKIASPVRRDGGPDLEGKRVIVWSNGLDEEIEEGKSKSAGANKDNAYSY